MHWCKMRFQVPRLWERHPRDVCLTFPASLQQTFTCAPLPLPHTHFEEKSTHEKYSTCDCFLSFVIALLMFASTFKWYKLSIKILFYEIKKCDILHGYRMYALANIQNIPLWVNIQSKKVKILRGALESYFLLPGMCRTKDDVIREGRLALGTWLSPLPTSPPPPPFSSITRQTTPFTTIKKNTPPPPPPLPTQSSSFWLSWGSNEVSIGLLLQLMFFPHHWLTPNLPDGQQVQFTMCNWSEVISTPLLGQSFICTGNRGLS